MLTETSFSVSRRGIRYSRRVLEPPDPDRIGSLALGLRIHSLNESRAAFDVAIVQPVGAFEPKNPDENDPEHYSFTDQFFRGLTLAAASDQAGEFNNRILRLEGPSPRQWAMVFAPGALDELVKAA